MVGGLMKKNLTREEKRAIALSEGREYLYIACPLCSQNRILQRGGIISGSKGKSGRASFSSFDFDGSEGKFFIQVRKNAGGRGGGFWLDDSQSLTFAEAKESPEYQEILEEIKEQCKKILKELE